MRHKKFLILLAVTLMAFSFTGCTFQGKTVYFELPCGSNTVFKIGDMTCNKDEALVYLLNAKNIYGTVDGVNLWSEDFNTSVINSSLKDEVLDHITRVYVLDLYANEQEITLSDAEISKCKTAAAYYYANLNKDEIAFTGTSEKNLEQMYERYELAQKVYTELMDSVDEEVSEDEARVMEAYVLFVSDESTADSIQSMINNGYTFERLAATYTELDSYQVTFGRGEYPQEVDDVVFNLDTDEVSGAIAADNGYYFFQCLDKYDEELSEENKEVIIESRRQQVLDDIVTEQQERYYSDMNTSLWEEIELPKESADNLTSDSFFSTLAEAK